MNCFGCYGNLYFLKWLQIKAPVIIENYMSNITDLLSKTPSLLSGKGFLNGKISKNSPWRNILRPTGYYGNKVCDITSNKDKHLNFPWAQI